MPTIRIQFADRVIEKSRDSRHIPNSRHAALIIDRASGEEVGLFISKHPTMLRNRISPYQDAIEAGDYELMFSTSIKTLERIS